MIGEHFWREPPQENESRTVIGLFRERNVCRFEAAAWGRGALRDSGPSGCEGDYKLMGFRINFFKTDFSDHYFVCVYSKHFAKAQRGTVIRQQH